jgi:hypothetical protein
MYTIPTDSVLKFLSTDFCCWWCYR